MRTSTVEIQIPDTESVTVTADTLSVDLSDGRTLEVPLTWFPQLLHASPEERNHWRLIGKGQGIYYPRVWLNSKRIHIMVDANIFNVLFKYYPRPEYTPWENFLTEAIAYILKTEPCAMEVWLSLMLDRAVKVHEYAVLTQNSERTEDQAATVFPDLKVTASLEGGEQQTVYCEHKWDSPCNPDQLRNYAELAKRDQGNSIVVFVGATQKQVDEARNIPPGVVQKAVCWADIYRSFKEIPNPSRMLQEFLVFMATQNIGSSSMINVTHLRLLPQVAVVMGQLCQYANRLLNEFPWDFLEDRYRLPRTLNGVRFPCVINRYGRIGIEFMTEGYAPTIVAGFLYDGSDHAVDLTRPDNGIDLMLRIEANPANNPDNNIGVIIQKLKEGRQRILEKEKQQGQRYHTRVRLRDELGIRDNWSLMIAQKCLADVIENCDSEAKQLQAIYDYFRQMLTALFSDPDLENTLRTLNPSPRPVAAGEGRARGWPHSPNC